MARTVPSYQRWLAGDETAISELAKQGVRVFRGIGCSRCHSGPMLSDFEVHRFSRGGEAIRTPSLRNVMRTAPYFNDGRAATLDAVFDVYRRVDEGDDPLFRNLRVPRGQRSRRDRRLPPVRERWRLRPDRPRARPQRPRRRRPPRHRRGPPQRP